jgi:hypothetical protein
MLAAGLDGIENERQLPPPVEGNVFELRAEERASRGIATLPGSLIEAIEVAEQSPFLRSALGDHVFESLIAEQAHRVGALPPAHHGFRAGRVPADPVAAQWPRPVERRTMRSMPFYEFSCVRRTPEVQDSRPRKRP